MVIDNIGKYKICGVQKTENGFRYGLLYHFNYKTDAWKMKRLINKCPHSKAYIKVNQTKTK